MLHLMDDAKRLHRALKLERIVKAQSGHVPVPIALVEKPGRRAGRDRRRRGALDQAEAPRSALPNTPTSTAALPASSMSRR